MYKRISPDEAHTMISERSPIIVDVRDPGSFEQAHIKGAIRLDNDNLPGFLETTDKQQPVLVFCYHGNSSQQAGAYLAEQGLEEVYSVDGGMEGWKQRFGL